MADLITVAVPSSVAALLLKDAVKMFLYRNGSNRRLTEAKVIEIVQKETGPMKTKLGEIGEAVARVEGLIEGSQALKASGGR